jgi:uncharacterized protein YjeT (DUF2065 family)
VSALGILWDTLIVAVCACAILIAIIAMFLPKEQRSMVLRKISRKLVL